MPFVALYRSRRLADGLLLNKQPVFRHMIQATAKYTEQRNMLFQLCTQAHESASMLAPRQ